eukprot:3632020-Pyramimonas_sp.AAC.1
MYLVFHLDGGGRVAEVVALLLGRRVVEEAHHPQVPLRRRLVDVLRAAHHLHGDHRVGQQHA